MKREWVGKDVWDLHRREREREREIRVEQASPDLQAMERVGGVGRGGETEERE